MSEEDRRKWNARYAEGAYGERPHPAQLLADWLPRLPKGTALDLGCGAGRNAVFLAQNGFEVQGLDVSDVGLERARERWSLSPLTLPHALVQVIIAEALYRAWTVKQGHPYHR